jgi:hypothetical protein
MRHLFFLIGLEMLPSFPNMGFEKIVIVCCRPHDDPPSGCLCSLGQPSMLENTRHGGIGRIGNFYYSGILEKFTAQLLRTYHLPCKLQDPKVSARSGFCSTSFLNGALKAPEMAFY